MAIEIIMARNKAKTAQMPHVHSHSPSVIPFDISSTLGSLQYLIEGEWKQSSFELHLTMLTIIHQIQNVIVPVQGSFLFNSIKFHHT